MPLGENGKSRVRKKDSAFSALDDEKKKKNKSGRKSHEVPTKELLSRLGGSVPKEVLDMPVDPNEPTYCVCQQVRIFSTRLIMRMELKSGCSLRTIL